MSRALLATERARASQHSRTAVLSGLLHTARPRYWARNTLVAAAPLSNGAIQDPHVLAAVTVGFVAFCLSATGGYFINDARDAESDRKHPTKRARPVAAGVVSAPLAFAVGGTLIVAGIAFGGVFGGRNLATVLGSYAAVSVAYSLYLKDQPIIDLAVITCGFLLRTVAGSSVTGLPVSHWHLFVASFGALFIAAGKRYSEAMVAGERESATRPVLARYTLSYLRFVWGTSAAMTVVGYSLWAFEFNRSGDWVGLSVAPFALVVLRYAFAVDSGTAGSPEEVIGCDRVIQVLGAVWLVQVMLAVAR
ncbi:MAG TPA: decaprenyl-phosphate phosphoribosyltransferase [Micromonosporaceae bacterium]|nr:decaprenyl-phosphate phosphoribosyltransferase [Micromonosporaceae bacterium]